MSLCAKRVSFVLRKTGARSNLLDGTGAYLVAILNLNHDQKRKKNESMKIIYIKASLAWARTDGK